MYSQFSPAFNNLKDASAAKDAMTPGVKVSIPRDGNSRLQEDQLIEKAMLADNFIEHGLLKVDKSVSIFGEIINLSEGRDKMFKIFSGFLKIAHYFVIRSSFLSQTRKDDVASRIKGASSATSTARGFLKLFTDWVFFRLAVRVYYKQRWGLLKVLSLGRLIGLALYFTFQMPVWLHTTKLDPHIDKGFWSKLSLKTYIFSTLCQILMDIQKLRGLIHDIGFISIFTSKDKEGGKVGVGKSGASGKKLGFFGSLFSRTRKRSAAPGFSSSSPSPSASSLIADATQPTNTLSSSLLTPNSVANPTTTHTITDSSLSNSTNTSTTAAGAGMLTTQTSQLQPSALRRYMTAINLYQLQKEQQQQRVQKERGREMDAHSGTGGVSSRPYPSSATQHTQHPQSAHDTSGTSDISTGDNGNDGGKGKPNEDFSFLSSSLPHPHSFSLPNGLHSPSTTTPLSTEYVNNRYNKPDDKIYNSTVTLTSGLSGNPESPTFPDSQNAAYADTSLEKREIPTAGTFPELSCVAAPATTTTAVMSGSDGGDGVTTAHAASLPFPSSSSSSTPSSPPLSSLSPPVSYSAFVTPEQLPTSAPSTHDNTNNNTTLNNNDNAAIDTEASTSALPPASSPAPSLHGPSLSTTSFGLPSDCNDSHSEDESDAEQHPLSRLTHSNALVTMSKHLSSTHTRAFSQARAQSQGVCAGVSTASMGMGMGTGVRVDEDVTMGLTRKYPSRLVIASFPVSIPDNDDNEECNDSKCDIHPANESNDGNTFPRKYPNIPASSSLSTTSIIPISSHTTHPSHTHMPSSPPSSLPSTLSPLSPLSPGGLATVRDRVAGIGPGSLGGHLLYSPPGGIREERQGSVGLGGGNGGGGQSVYGNSDGSSELLFGAHAFPHTSHAAHTTAPSNITSHSHNTGASASIGTHPLSHTSALALPTPYTTHASTSISTSTSARNLNNPHHGSLSALKSSQSSYMHRQQSRHTHTHPSPSHHQHTSNGTGAGIGLVHRHGNAIPLPAPSQHSHPPSAHNSVSDQYRQALCQTQLPSTVADSKVALLRRDLQNSCVNFIKDGGDLLGALNGAYDLGFSDLVSGLLSVVSGGISLYRLWRRFKTVVEKTIEEKSKAKRMLQQKEMLSISVLAATEFNHQHPQHSQHQQQQQVVARESSTHTQHPNTTSNASTSNNNNNNNIHTNTNVNANHTHARAASRAYMLQSKSGNNNGPDSSGSDGVDGDAEDSGAEDSDCEDNGVVNRNKSTGTGTSTGTGSDAGTGSENVSFISRHRVVKG